MQLDLSSAQIAVTVAIGVVTVLGTIFGWFGKAWTYVAGLFRKAPPVGMIDVPTKSFVILPESRANALWWHMGAIGGNAAMQIVGDFNITNVSKFDVRVMGVRMRKPKAAGLALVKDQHSPMYSSGHIIPTGAVSKLRLDLWVQPPVKSAGELFRCDIAILDQFGNEHWLKKLEFKYQ